MADRPRYPQIPTGVWWGVRHIFERSPSAPITDKLLIARLGVQKAAAKQYVTELKSVGLIDEEGKSTGTARKWRTKEGYLEGVEELLAQNYPSELVSLYPPSDSLRNEVVDWFTAHGFGKGTAQNKAATYFLIGSPEPEQPSEGPSKRRTRSGASAATRTTEPTIASEKTRSDPRGGFSLTQSDGGDGTKSLMPLNVNVQIHISADASSDQIELIFASMRKHLANDS